MSLDALKRQWALNKADQHLPLTSKERDCINTMIDFFRSSGEGENLDPEVYEAIAEKLDNGRKRTPLETARHLMTLLAKDLHGHAADTVGFEEDGETIMKGSVQEALYARVTDALKALDNVKALTLPETATVSSSVLDCMGSLLGAIEALLRYNGYDTADCSECVCKQFEQSDKGLTCVHTEARIAQRDMRKALHDAGFVEDNFGAWDTP